MVKQASCNRVFIIGLDGAIGRCVKEAHTPVIDAFIAGGSKTYSAHTVYPSSSFPAWGSMFHGVGPEKHMLGNPVPCPEDVSWPSFMKLLRQERPDSRMASFSCWGPINSNIIELSCECYCVSMPDLELVNSSTEYIRKTPPDILFMQLDDIDAAGHMHGYGTKSYLDQIAVTDALVGLVIDAIHDAGVFDESLIILLSDHGGHEKGHGTDHPDCMTTFWACRGPGVVPIGTIADMNIMDTAAIVALSLGLSCPPGWDAKIPGGIFAK